MCSLQPVNLALCGRCIGRTLPGCDSGLRRLYNYWDAKRGEREFPARADIDPLDLPALLPNIFLVDVLPADAPDQNGTGQPQFRYRLAGTRVDEIHGQSLTGKMPSDIKTAEIANEVESQYRQVLVDRRPRCDHVVLLARDHSFWHYERLILPLSEDGVSINMLLCAIYLT